MMHGTEEEEESSGNFLRHLLLRAARLRAPWRASPATFRRARLLALPRAAEPLPADQTAAFLRKHCGVFLYKTEASFRGACTRRARSGAAQRAKRGRRGERGAGALA